MHTHVVVPNVTVDRTGRWSALAGDRVYRWAKTLGYLYQAALRHELTDTLGVSWGPVRKGAAEMDGIDAALIGAFSKRRAQITQAMDAAGGTSRASAQTATLATRAAKGPGADLDALRRLWHEEAGPLAISVDRLTRHLVGRSPYSPDMGRVTADLLSAQGLTAQTSTFDRRDVLQAIAIAHGEGAPITALRQAADTFLERAEVVSLPSTRPAGRRFTTSELLELEAAAIAGAERRGNAQVAMVDPTLLERALAERPTLSDEQRCMVTSLTTSGAGVEVVVGRAGAGKTYALDAARSAWQAAGCTVIGAALAARAAAELQSGAGVPASTIDRLLADLDRPGPLSDLAPRTVIICDESGMVGTRKLARLLYHAERHQAKVVLVGDHLQLPEIEAGGAFAALTEKLPTSELSDNRRQTQTWERQALAELRAGSVSDAVTAYRRAGRITLASDAPRARERMVADWWDARRSGEDAAMYALRRSDVDDLNQRARALLDEAGLLGPDRLEVARKDFAIGDEVQCLRNNRRLGIRNGDAASVIAVHPESSELTLDNGTRLPRDYLEAGHLGYRYATTIHKAQGATVGRAFLLGSEGLYREAGYVGLSRARTSTQLYLVSPPANPQSGIEMDPVVEAIRQLGQSRAQALAIETLDHHRNPTPAIGSGAPAGLALLADPDPWLVDALGPPPPTGTDRDRWARDAERIAAYRDIYAITDPGDALGPRPEPQEQRRAWELARLTIHEHRRSLEHDQGLHL